MDLRFLVAAAILCCGCAAEDEVDAEAAAILKHVPKDSPFREAPGAMQAMGFSCMQDQRSFTDAKGRSRDAEPHLSCEREVRHWLVCTKRTRAIVLQLNGRVSNVLVNVGEFC